MANPFAVEVLALVALYWGTVLVKLWRFRRKHGHSPAFKPRTAADMVLLVLWVAVIVAWFAQPLHALLARSRPLVLAPMAALDGPWARAVGSFLAWLGYLFSLWAWRAMGRAWRLGVDATERTRLVTTGPFALCRHPIYASQAVALFGSFLILPTPLLAGAVVVHGWCVWRKSVIEERHMTNLHGDAYAEYRRRVGRFLWRFRPPPRAPVPGAVRPKGPR